MTQGQFKPSKTTGPIWLLGQEAYQTALLGHRPTRFGHKAEEPISSDISYLVLSSTTKCWSYINNSNIFNKRQIQIHEKKEAFKF